MTELTVFGILELCVTLIDSNSVHRTPSRDITVMLDSADDPMGNYYGNTLYVTPEKGRAHYVYYNPDKTFQVFFAEGHYAGTYTVTATEVCLTAVRPRDTQPTTKCHGFDKTRRPGETWSEMLAGAIVHFRLIAGRHDNPKEP